MKTQNNTTTSQDAVNILNELLALDKDCIQKLCDTRIPCNEALANHTTVQVRGDKQEDGSMKYSVGIIGLINGIFGNVGGEGKYKNWGTICAYNNEVSNVPNFEIQGFSLVDITEEEE